MALFVFKTEKCKEDSRNHSIEKEISGFESKIIKNQRTSFFDNFPPPYLKKRFKNHLRLLAAERKIEDDVVIIFYRILQRGGREYANFLKSPKEYGDNNFATMISDEKLKEWIKEQKIEKTIPEKKEISDEEWKFLYGLNGTSDYFSGDYFVYETYTWIEKISNSEIQNRLINIPEKLTAIIEKEDNSGIVKFDQYYISYILFENEKILFLSDITKDSVETKQLGKNVEEIRRKSAKSYPAIFLYDEDIWIKIETNNEANIALSPEEADLLKSIHENAPESGFPIFINGRAGSGKSTILQYLFVDYIKSYMQDNFSSFKPPIFLTYSKSLVDSSKKNIQSLLRHHYKNIEDKIENLSIVNDSIKTFKEFLLQFIPKEEREKLFDDSKYLDYSLFKEKWIEQFGKDPQAYKNYNADISWHVIRSYIKGVSNDGYLELDEYTELPDDERSVTYETYKIVYEKVWQNWYKPLCEINDDTRNYWDDQDIVRYIIENDLAEPVYPALFCDESQDFTKIELEFLLRINLFSDRKIDSNTIKRIPFAFAGDPFQTLNPTGFRWESIKSTYVDKFIYSLSPELRFGNPKLNYKELTFNYRSSENIVKLSNSVQLLRKYLFNYQSIKPQNTWHIEANPPIPAYYFIDDEINQQKIKEQKGIAIIVPCANGEEMDFVKQDSFLREIIEIDESGVPQNIYSPMRAKGLEFKRVLLYRFSEIMPDNIDFESKKIEELTLEEDINKKIQIEYFINQLYVGVSRAQKRLFIIEKRENLHKLWRFVADIGYQDELFSYFNVSEDWNNNIGTIVKGRSEGWEKEKENINNIALQLETEGKLKQDSYLLRQAALYYNNLSQTSKNKECSAFANLYENKYRKAGDLFFEISMFENALDAYWKGKEFKSINKFKENEKAAEFINRIEVRTASLIISNENDVSLSTIQNYFERLSDYFKNKTISPLWKDGIQKLIVRLYSNNSFSDDDYKVFYSIIILYHEKINFSENILGDIAYKGKLYKKAYKHYENSGKINTPQYKESKAKFLFEVFSDDSSSLEQKDVKFIADYFYEQKKYEDSLMLYSKINNSDGIIDTLNALCSKLNSNKIIKYVDTLFDSLVIDEKWSKILILHDNAGKLIKCEKIINVIKNNQEELLHKIVKEIATDVLIQFTDNKIKENLSSFLRKHFINKPISNWSKGYYPELVGSAIEKAGRDIDALKYYEKISKYRSFDSETKSRAKKRWIKVKLKQAEREEEHGIKEKAKIHKKEAEKVINEMNFTPDTFDEPEYPDIVGFINIPVHHNSKDDLTIDNNKPSGSTPTIKEKENLKFTIEDYSFNVLRERNRINIELTNDGYQIAILTQDRVCKSTDISFDKIGDHFDSDYIKVNFNKEKTEITIKDLGIELKI